MKYILYTLLSLTVSRLSAQNPLSGSHSFVYKGHIDHPQEKFVPYGITTYLDYWRDSIPLDANGDFTRRIAIQGETQDIQIEFRDSSLNLYAQSGDTLDARWDDAISTGAVTIRNTNPEHNRGLQAQIALHKQYNHEYSGVSQVVYDRNQTDSLKFATVSDFFTRQMQTLSDQHPDSFGLSKIGADIYYQCTTYLMMNMMLPKYRLKSGVRDFQMQSETDFHNSDDYRNFLFNYLRVGGRLLNGYKLEGTPEEKKSKIIPYSPPLDDYYNALANIKVYEIRDWFITKSIMFDFEEYSFNDASQVYQDFISKARVKDYADTLRHFYASVQRLKPGAEAPGFTLWDSAGRTVSLSDFKGKVVMIDFWGVNCGPCMYDIRNRLPALHERYRDKEIVFLNVCVDSDIPAWKKCLEDVHLGGVNVLATGWTRNPVCQSYGINGIPHYYLIDADGRIAANNGMTYSSFDKIDAALAKIPGK